MLGTKLMVIGMAVGVIGLFSTVLLFGLYGYYLFMAGRGIKVKNKKRELHPFTIFF